MEEIAPNRLEVHFAPRMLIEVLIEHSLVVWRTHACPGRLAGVNDRVRVTDTWLDKDTCHRVLIISDR